MAMWTITREADVLVLTHRNDLGGEVCCARMWVDELERLVEEIMGSGNQKVGDQVLLPDGRILLFGDVGATA